MSTQRATPVVLFVCVRNAGRSQMAEGLFNRAAAGRALARSAGSRPDSAVHPVVAEAMAEVGIDLTGAKPKSISAEVTDGVTVVVGMGCGDACPRVPGALQLEWEVPDPAGLSLNEVRGIRNDISRQVGLLLAEIL